MKALARPDRLKAWSASAILSALVVNGCGADSAIDAWTGSVHESDGVLVVDNPEKGIWTSATSWRFEENLRIGVTDGDPARQFSAVVDLTVDSAGQIYVLDRQAGEIRVFDSEGG